MLGALAHMVDTAVQIDAGQLAFRIGEHERLERRHARERLQAQPVGVGGHGAPGEHVEPFFVGDGGDGLFLTARRGNVTVEERDAGRVMPRLGQVGVDGGAHELVGHGHEDAGAVAGVLLGADGTAVVEIHQHLDGVVNDFAFRLSIEGGDHAYTAGVMLGTGVVHAFRAMNRQI